MRTLAPASVLLPVLCAVASCAPGDQQPEGSSPEVQAEVSAQPPSDSKPRIPEELEGTAWRVAGADGASYVTSFDPDGRYRDDKDGEPFHEGTWDRRADGSICFLPDGSEAQRRCWKPDGMTDEGNMVVVGGEDGARVELTPGDYEPPASEEGP